MKVLNSVDIKVIPVETLSKLNPNARYQFISSLEISNLSKQMLEIISEEQKSDLCTRLMNLESTSSERLDELFGKEYIHQQIILARLTYSLQRETNSEVKNKITYLYENDDDFKKYLLFRYENNVNNVYDKETNPDKTMPLSGIMKEYTNNTELIKNVLNSEEAQNKTIQLLLKYYIQNSYNTSLNISTIEELKKYPKQILEMQQTIIENGNREDILNIITQNLTGLSSEDFSQYRSMFLDNHDLEAVLENTGETEKLKNLTIVKELLDLTTTLDDEQIKEFASNLSLRNYNELMQGDFSLVSMRENFIDFLGNIEQEYGKEINKSLGYDISEKENVEYKGQNVTIADINGPFKVLIHMTKPNNYDNHTCMSLLSEGHYDVAMEDYGVKEDPEVAFFIFDDVPPELLYASANHNMSSNSQGRTNANFMTTDNTILNAEPELETSDVSFTEQNYFYQGFSKEGKFITLKPKALATFQEEPNEHTLKLAAQYGLEILRIPDMQSNLQHMLENDIVTPGLVKGFEGDSTQIINALSTKKTLTHNEVLALQALKGKDVDEGIQQQIDQMLEKIPKARGKEEIKSLTSEITLSEIKEMSDVTRQMYQLINNPQITHERE